MFFFGKKNKPSKDLSPLICDVHSHLIWGIDDGVKTEEEAREVLAVIKKGKKMEEVARARTLDAGSKATGGDIGWQVPALLVPPVRDAIKSLAKGQLSDPVQSQFGWHILRVEESKPFQFPEYDKVKATLQQQLQTQANLKAIAEVRKNAAVK